MAIECINPAGLPVPADTLVGVEALSRSGYLIEVDAIAVA